MSSICLNMIVKDEAHIIASTLNNILNNIPITYYVISDTGSTDNTKEIIKNFFDSKNIKGEIFDDKWEDFGHNRTLALAHAYKKTDYLLIFDADDKFNGTFVLPSKLTEDSYYLKFGGYCNYKRILLVNNNIKWKFVGVLHEYITTLDNIPFKYETIDGNYYIDSGKSGSRSNDPEKYKKDAIILENAYYKALEQKDKVYIRYSFYCAQSYRDSNQKEKAIEWYLKRTTYDDWLQEVYYSYYMVGKLYYDLKQFQNAIYYWSIAYEVDDRYECLYEIISHFRKLNKFNLAFQYYKMIKTFDIKMNDKLFIYHNIYNYLLDIELILICYHINEPTIGFQSFQKLLSNKTLENHHRYIIINIFPQYLKYINNYDTKLIQLLCNNLKQLYINNKNISNNDILQFNNVINYYSKLHTNTKGLTLKSKENNINIFLSITSCKRYDLFEKTINSILTNWLDIEKIDYFMCVDDNSSKEDRTKMKKNYPFFNYYLKNENEKGHLSSMNIIWDKLNELKPTYWIHLEDDWLFFKPDIYVLKSVHFLKKYKDQNIHQILFNKNYAETLYNYNLVGGTIIDNNTDFLLHIKDEPNLNGSNSAYWPHYSFRPSMVLTETILKLGNYDSPETFFERYYANKYFNNGYKSAFFNEVTSLHIGKLTSEKNSDKPNAYYLNSTNQFNNTSHNIPNTKFIFQKINENYILLKGQDHYGDDIIYKPNLSIDEMINYAENNNNVICFNTIGYFKHSLNFDSLISFHDENKGIIINLKRLKEKYNINLIQT